VFTLRVAIALFAETFWHFSTSDFAHPGKPELYKRCRLTAQNVGPSQKCGTSVSDGSPQRGCDSFLRQTRTVLAAIFCVRVASLKERYFPFLIHFRCSLVHLSVWNTKTFYDSFKKLVFHFQVGMDNCCVVRFSTTRRWGAPWARGRCPVWIKVGRETTETGESKKKCFN
jgi:hypothetical protein